MVMAADVLDFGRNAMHEGQDTWEPMALHEQLVAQVRAVSGEEDTRSSVWGEHSYARSRGSPPGALVRVLLEPSEPAAPREPLDVTSPPDARPRARAPEREQESDADEDEDEEWEARLAEMAPSGAHARLAASVTDILRDLRLERAASRGFVGERGGARAAARRLRRSLAAHWGGAAGWALGALRAQLPPPMRALLSETLGELRRAAPRLCERLPPAPSPRADSLDAVGEACGAGAAGPWLAWAGSGCAAQDARWTRRLGALLHVRALPAPAPPAGPERWCAAQAQAARAALAHVLADAGPRGVVLCGVGAGAALAAWLAAGAAVRGLVLLAPPLLTAEGARDRPADALLALDVPLLLVAGGGAAQCWRGAGAALAAARPARRLLLVAGADDALMVPRALRRRLRVPQAAVDAAVAEECARWASRAPDEAGEGAPRRRAAPSSPPAGSEEARGGIRSIEIIEGRVVCRGSGAEPLPLTAPRRADAALRRSERPPRRGSPALAAADIMQLPIVFADDDPPEAPRGEPPAALTVTSGARASARRRLRVPAARPPGAGAAPDAAPARPPPAREPGGRRSDGGLVVSLVRL